TGHRCHYATGELHDAHAAIVEVGQEEALGLRIEGDAVDPAELRLDGRAAVAAEALLAGTGDGGHDAGLAVNLADALVPGVGEVDVAVGCDGEVVQAVDLCFCCGTSVAAVALLAVTGDGRQDALRVHLADAVAGQLDDVHVAGPVEIDA